jgi:HEAT repeat protein
LVEVAENSQHNASRIGWAVGGLRHLHEKGTSVRAALEKLRNSLNDSIAKVARQAFDSIYLTPSDSLPSPPIDRTVVEKQFTDEPNRWRKIDKLRPLIVVDADISFAEKTIVEVWNDPELEKRLVAVNGIGIGAGPKLAKLVAKILRQTHSPRVQVAALETLARIGPRAAAESQVALNALKSSNSWVRHSALDALLRMAVRDTSSRDAFVRALRDPDAGNRGIAILGLEPFEGDALPGLDGLIEMLKDPENQRTTARVIGKIGPGALGPQRLDQLLQLRANHPGLIAESLELIGPQAVPGLLEVLRHPRPIVRSTDPNAMPPHDDRAWALNILGQMRPSVDDPIPTLLEVFRTVDDKTAASVVWVALRQGGRCVPLLREALRHSHADVRRAAVYGCVQLGFAARALLPELRVIVSEKPGTIYDEALLAISKMGPAAVQATEELRANTLHVNHDEVRQFITLFDEDRQRRIWVAFRQFESRYTRQTLRKG